MSEVIAIGISTEAARVISIVKNAVSKSPTGVSFFRVTNYTNKNGEVANHKINVGARYDRAKAKDIEFLENLDVTTMTWKSSMVDILKAKTALIEAFKNPDKARSEGQINAYTHICPSVKVHNETGLIYLYGLRVKKEVIVKGEYKTVNSSALTIAKDELRKLLKTGKFVNFSIAVGNELTGWGNTIVIKN